MIDIRLKLEVADGAIRSTLTIEPEGQMLAQTTVTGAIPSVDLKSASPQALASLGKALARLALPSTTQKILGGHLGLSRVRLWLDLTAELQSVPWEFIWVDALGDMPLVQHPLVTFARGVTVGDIPRLPRHRENRILLAFADPGSRQYPRLPAAEREIDSVRRSMSTPRCEEFKIRELRNARRETLLHQIRDHRPDVVHFAGHGAILPSGGALILEGGANTHEALYAEEFAAALREAGTRLVVLSGCTTGGDAARVGDVLLREGIPTVVAMQGEIRDTTAYLFARTFYSALAEGQPVDIAVQEGRFAILGCAHEWGVPVLLASPTEASHEEAPSPAPRLNYGREPRPFFGRTRQRQELWAFFRDPQVRMVTLFGVGGMGKTRLAKQIGFDLQSQFPDGVRLVECDALSGRDEILGAIARAVETPSGELKEVAQALSERQTLLILDCYERHIRDADVVNALLLASTHLKILVTSRIVLDLPWEHAYELESLKGGSAKGKPSERVELFFFAARQANPAISLTKDRVRIEAMVELLQGVPLAMLLAAARLRHFSLEDLEERLRVRLLDTLQRPSPTRDRHASIRIVVEDSFDLLADGEKRFATQLAVFAGGFTLNDACAVVPGEFIEEGIARLYDQSLLSVRESPEGRRFYPYDTVREFLLEVADEVTLSTVRGRHAEYFANRAQELARATDEADVRERLWRDIGNYRAAVRHANAVRDDRLIVTFARALARTFLEASFYSDFEILAAAAIQTGRDQNDAPLLIEILGLQGMRLRRQGDLPGAEGLWRQRAKLCRSQEDISGEVDSYLDIADSALRRGEIEIAREMLAHFHRLRETLPSEELLATGHVVEAQVLLRTGDRNGALIAVGISASIVEKLPVAERFTQYVWLSQARIYREVGWYDEGIALCHRIIQVSLRSNQAHNVAISMLELAAISAAQGEISAAWRTLLTVEQAFGRFASLSSRIRTARESFQELHDLTLEAPFRRNKKTWQIIVQEWQGS